MLFNFPNATMKARSDVNDLFKVVYDCHPRAAYEKEIICRNKIAHKVYSEYVKNLYKTIFKKRLLPQCKNLPK